MKGKLILGLGIGLLVLAGAAFLLASVGLATADRIEGLEPPSGAEWEGAQWRLPADDPTVVARKRQASTVLTGSFVAGLVGLLVTGWGWRSLRKARHETG